MNPAPAKSRLNQIWTFLTLLVIGGLLFSACAPVPLIKKKEKAPSLETANVLERFKEGERLFTEKAYPEALTIFQDYLREFPRGALADTALMKTGLIHQVQGDHTEARMAFEQLIKQHRRSPFLEDARYNVMLTYYSEGNFETAVEYGEILLEHAKTALQVFRLHHLMGYAQNAVGKFKDAVISYMTAYNLGSEEERAEILSKVKEVITYLEEEDLTELLEIYGNRLPADYLRLQLAKEWELQDHIYHAIDILTEFVNLYPDHEEIESAAIMIEELKSRLLVNPFLIGCILPLSGPYEVFGNRALTGIELALDLFNSQLDVHPVQLLIMDSKGEPKEAAAAVESLVLKNGVVGIIGPMITSESAAIKAQFLKVPIITLTQKPTITSVGDYVFRNFLTHSLQIKTIVDYSVNDLGLEKFAIFYPKEPYGISFMNRFWDELIIQGGEVVAIESYSPEQTDFSEAIKKLVGLHYPRPEESLEFLGLDTDDDLKDWDSFLRLENPETPWLGQEEPQDLDEAEEDAEEITSELEEMPEEADEEPRAIVDFEAVFIPDSFEKVGLITPQLLFHDVEDVLLMGTNLWHSNKLIEMSRSYVQGAILPEGFFSQSPSPEVQDFVETYKSIFGTTPTFLEAQSYDTAGILFNAVNNPEVLSRRTLKNVLLEVKDFQGVTGLTSFNETGDAEKDLFLLQIGGRRFQQIKP